MQEQSIFIAALEKKDPVQRAAFLDEACRGDCALRERIERLLERNAQAGSFLEPSSADVANDAVRQLVLEDWEGGVHVHDSRHNDCVHLPGRLQGT